jgi:hypothetical protein
MRRPWALGLGALALASAVLGACGEDSPPAPAPAPAPAPGSPEPPGPAPAAGDATPAFTTPEQCGKCHVEIYEEWKASFHGLAMSDPLFLDLAPPNKEECIRCHAPVPLREVDFETPTARSERREDAISCLTCHQSGGNVTGPFEGLSGACRPVYDEAQRNVVKMCFPCHNQHDTGTEWLDGPYGPRAREPRVQPEKSCLDCHMPEVERPLVAGGPVRKGRKHTWPGGHSMEQLRKAVAIDVATERLAAGGTRIRGFVTNRGAGHNIPTDARHRSFDVYFKVWDANGAVILDPLDVRQQGRARVATHRKFYRNSGRKDTQVPPLARVSGMHDEPGYLDLPGVTSGRGEMWLVYRLTPSDVLSAASLEEGPVVHYRARVVLRKDFTFGP